MTATILLVTDASSVYLSQVSTVRTTQLFVPLFVETEKSREMKHVTIKIRKKEMYVLKTAK